MGIGADTEIAGKLRLVKPLGQGSAGQVWLARHLRLGSEVAVKFLNRDVSVAPTARERFVREARTIAKIRSPHVVQVHDFGFHEEHAYLVMEYLVGETLEARLERVGALTLEQVVRICTQIAKALQKAHDAGLIHRDIKPANVFLVDYGDEEIAKVVDFGIVKSTAGSLTTSTVDTLTQTGSLLGTPYYMSPEQIQDSGNVGHQADLWALGVIAYESVLGRLPFNAPNFPRLVVSICRDPIPVPSSIAPVPPAFDDWVARALHRDPARRFQSAKELARELCQALIFGSDCVAMPDGVVPPDLLWSGAYPSAGLDASRTSHISDSPPAQISIAGSDRPSAPAAKTVRVASEPPNAAIPDAVIHGLPLPAMMTKVSPSASQDGSLASQIAAPHTAAPPVRSGVSRAVLLGAGAAALLAIGWFANRCSVARNDAALAVPSGIQQPAGTALAASSAPAAPAPAAPPAASSAASAGSVGTIAPPPPTATLPARVVSTTPPRSAPPVGTATAAPAETAAPPAAKYVDPLEERQ